MSHAAKLHETRGLLVTGTDTGVGKTFVTARAAADLCAKGHVVGAYKPACSGAAVDADGRRRWEDVERLHAAIGGAYARERVGPQCFEDPLAPPVAARREGRVVDERLLAEGAAWWLGRVEVLLIEGVGGLLCPLTEAGTVADLAEQVGFPLLVVARAGLGTINHTLLTLDAADRRGLRIAAVLLNNATSETAPACDETRTNAEEIARRGGVRVLGPLPWMGHRTPDCSEEAGPLRRPHGAILESCDADPHGADLRSPGSPVRIDWFSLASPPRPSSRSTFLP